MYNYTKRQILNILEYYFETEQILSQNEGVAGNADKYCRLVINQGTVIDNDNLSIVQPIIFSLQIFEVKNKDSNLHEQIVNTLKIRFLKNLRLIKYGGNIARLDNINIIKVDNDSNYYHINLNLTYNVYEDLRNG